MVERGSERGSVSTPAPAPGAGGGLAGSSADALPLEHYAAIVAALGDEHALAEVLAVEGVPLSAWARADVSHKARLARDPEAFEGFVRALFEAEDRAARAVRPLADDAPAWVAFLAAFEREGAGLLPALGLTMNDLSRLGREWDRRVARDDKLAARLAELRQELKKSGARPATPRLTLGPRRLVPSPFARAAGSPLRPEQQRGEGELEAASLDLASYARIAAELLERPRERGSVLFEHRVAEGAFAALEARWLARFDVDAQAARDFRTLREHERTRLRGVLRQRRDTDARLFSPEATRERSPWDAPPPLASEPASRAAPPAVEPAPLAAEPAPREPSLEARHAARSPRSDADEGTSVGFVPTLLARDVLPFSRRGERPPPTEPSPPPDDFDPRATAALPSALHALGPALPFEARAGDEPELGQTAELPVMFDEPTADDGLADAMAQRGGEAHGARDARYPGYDDAYDDDAYDDADEGGDDLGATAPLPSAARLVELGILELPETVTAASTSGEVGAPAGVESTAVLELAMLAGAGREPGAVTGTMVLDPSLVRSPSDDEVLAITSEHVAPRAEAAGARSADVVRVSPVSLSLARYAMLRAELGRAPERRGEILSQYALDEPALDALEASFIERFDSEPKLYADYRTLFERYRMWLAGK